MNFAHWKMNPNAPHIQVQNATQINPYICRSFPVNFGICCPVAFWEEIQEESKRLPAKHRFYRAVWDNVLGTWSDKKMVTPAYATISLMHINQDPTHYNYGLPFFTSITLHKDRAMFPTPIEEIFEFTQNPNNKFSIEQKQMIIAKLFKTFPSHDIRLKWYLDNWHSEIEQFYGHKIEIPQHVYEGQTL